MERTITMKSPFTRLVSIVIHECKDLKDEDLAGTYSSAASFCLAIHHALQCSAGKSDPYVTIKFPDADHVLSATGEGEKGKTSVVQDNCDPKVRILTKATFGVLGCLH